MNRQISIYRERRDLWRGAAALIRGLAEECVRDHGCFTLVLSGGKTPEELYARLAGGVHACGGAAGTGAEAALPWDKVYVFWGDERFVPYEHPDSNCGMARRTLLSRVAIPEGNVFPIPTDAGTPERAAAIYEETIRNEKHLRRVGETPAALPSFDLVLLGMGNDGHTASLYPGSGALEEKRRLVCAVEAPGKNSRDQHLSGSRTPTRPRITMTLPLINNAQNALFLVTGEDKKETLKRVLSEHAIPAQAFSEQALSSVNRDPRGEPLPAQLVCPRRALYFFTDVSLWQI
jgi:6-phosphogluconolactonase